MTKESFDKHQLISYRMEQAQETLKDAHLLFTREGSLRSVLNRAYYAMFYATVALLVTIEKGSSKHSGVIALFDRYFVKPGAFPKAMSKAIHKAFDLRQIGDYRELIQLHRQQVEEVLQSANQFVEDIEEYMKRS
ncbi:MAG: HEPN domain-containing protein [Chloroflexota bacterium]|nr:HEPN domain-containing protein [Chloroflexota bacterium]